MPNFKSSAGYRKWLAYGHMHGAMKGNGRLKVKIGGKAHKVLHGKKK